jgi:hypothetical protein
MLFVIAYFGSRENSTPALVPEPEGEANPTAKSNLNGLYIVDCALTKFSDARKRIANKNFFIEYSFDLSHKIAVANKKSEQLM